MVFRVSPTEAYCHFEMRGWNAGVSGGAVRPVQSSQLQVTACENHLTYGGLFFFFFLLAVGIDDVPIPWIFYFFRFLLGRF